MRNRSYRPRVEWLEARLAPALVTRDVPVIVIPAADTTQATSLVQALASNPTFGVGTNGAAGGVVAVLAAPASANSPGAAQVSGRAVTFGGFVTGFSSLPFARVLLVETVTPADSNAQQPASVTFLPVFLPTPNLLPATVFALLGTSATASAAPTGVLPFASVRGFLFPANFPGTLAVPARNLLLHPQPSGTSAAGSITGEVFQDVNGNGRHDGTEPGLGEVRLTLERRQGNRFEPIAETVSDADGHYAFTGLTAGTYRVRVATPAGRGVARDVSLVPGGKATAQDVGLPPRKRQAEMPLPPLADWVFSEWVEGPAPDSGRFLSFDFTGPDAEKAAVLPNAAGRSDESVDALTTAEVLAFTTAVVAEFEGIPGDERDRRKGWLPRKPRF